MDFNGLPDIPEARALSPAQYRETGGLKQQLDFLYFFFSNLRFS